MRPSLPGGRVVAGKTWKEGAKEAEGDGVPVAMRKDGGANWPFAPALEGGGSVDILRAESTECIRRCGEDCTPPPPGIWDGWKRDGPTADPVRQTTQTLPSKCRVSGGSSADR